MTPLIGIGFSSNPNSEIAARDAAFESKKNLRTDDVQLAIIFSSIHYNPKTTLPIIRDVLNHPKTIGCSTAGIILSNSIEATGIAVLTISSDNMEVGIGSVEDIHTQNMQHAGAILAQNSLKDFGHHPRSIFMLLADGQLKNNSLMLKGIQEVLGNVFPIVGAGSCDDFNFSQSFQMFQDKILTNSAAGFLLGGPLGVGVGAFHGWRPLGKPRIIDRADNNIIRTINGKRAFSLYEEYFGDEIKDLQSFKLGQISILYPLGLFIEGSSEYLLRNAVDILSDGSIVCQGDVPEGSEVHLMIGNKESCKQAAVKAAKDAQKNILGKQPQAIIVLESMTRLKLLGRSAYSEIKMINEVFGPSVPIIGMYANGEICPFQTVGTVKKPLLQNESIVIIAIG